LRISRSTSHGGGRRTIAAGHEAERDFAFVQHVMRASSMRGAWLVGPMKRLENS